MHKNAKGGPHGGHHLSLGLGPLSLELKSLQIGWSHQLFFPLHQSSHISRGHSTRCRKYSLQGALTLTSNGRSKELSLYFILLYFFIFLLKVFPFKTETESKTKVWKEQLAQRWASNTFTAKGNWSCLKIVLFLSRNVSNDFLKK